MSVIHLNQSIEFLRAPDGVLSTSPFSKHAQTAEAEAPEIGLPPAPCPHCIVKSAQRQMIICRDWRSHLPNVCIDCRSADPGV